MTAVSGGKELQNQPILPLETYDNDHNTNNDQKKSGEDFQEIAMPEPEQTLFVMEEEEEEEEEVDNEDCFKVKKRRLKADAVPSQWPGYNVPKYMSSKAPLKRDQSHATAQARFKAQQDRAENEYCLFLEREKVHSLDDILNKVDLTTLPEGVSIIRKTHCIIFMYIEELGSGQINVLFHLTIYQDLTFSMEIHNTTCPNSAVASITREERIQNHWEIPNILAMLKSLGENFFEDGSTLNRVITDFQNKVAKLTIQDNETEKKIGFLLEQLSLATQSKHSRKYSPDLLACGSMWKATSPALYKQILREGFLSLPTMSWLKKLTESMPMSFGLTDGIKSYLKMRIKDMPCRERKVLLAFDEIYVNQQVEFCGGRFFGLQTENRADKDPTKNPCKTVLCFHISSLFNPYEDIVAQYPVMNLDSSILKECYNSVMDALHEVGFEVVLLSCDNATPNRKFLTELCEGDLRESIPHPHHQGKRLFLLFDPVHGFKNMFNNFESRDRFVCPDFDDHSKVIFPTFKHVRELFEMELGKPVKMAYKLKKKAMCPKAIEKTNVMLAQSIFDDSTISAMEFYVQNLDKPWHDTLSFLKIVNRWWKIVNTKNPFLHVKTKDKTRAPIRSIQDENFQFLSKFHDWLVLWDQKIEGQGKQRPGFTPPTMTAMICSTKTLQEFTKDLLSCEGVEFVLLGKCQSDKLEARFGWFRQLSGANYFISCRQLLESDKLIKVKSLVKYSNMNLRDIKKIFESISTSEKDVIKAKALELASTIHFDASNHLQSLEDNNILFYVAGYLARSMSKRITCNSCSQLISQGKETLVPAFDDERSESGKSEQERFLLQVNRGGLSRPTDLLFVCCVHAYGMYNEIMVNEEAKKVILSAKYPREVFAEAFTSMASACPETASIIDVSCDQGHRYDQHSYEIVKRMFNFFGKNFANDMNSQIRAKKESKAQASAAAKIRKLQSGK